VIFLLGTGQALDDFGQCRCILNIRRNLLRHNIHVKAGAERNQYPQPDRTPFFDP